MREPTRAVHEKLISSNETLYTVPTDTTLEISSIILSNVTGDNEKVTLTLGGLDFPSDFEVPANDMITIPLKNSPIKLNAEERIEGLATGSSTATALLNEGTTDGEVTVETTEHGDDKNEYSVEVVDNSDTNDVSLSASFSDDVLTIDLATDSDGNLDDSENTASNITDEIESLEEFTASYSGDGSGVFDSSETVEFNDGADPTINVHIAGVEVS